MCLSPCLFFMVFTHQLSQSVDVDLSLLQSSTEEHGRRHQKVVGYPVSVDIHGCNFTAVVGADLKVAQMLKRVNSSGLFKSPTVI